MGGFSIKNYNFYSNMEYKTLDYVCYLQAVELKSWYCRKFKDSMMVDPPAWFKTFIYCEFLFQFPFFFAASYAFIKGM